MNLMDTITGLPISDPVPEPKTVYGPDDLIHVRDVHDALNENVHDMDLLKRICDSMGICYPARTIYIRVNAEIRIEVTTGSDGVPLNATVDEIIANAEAAIDDCDFDGTLTTVRFDPTDVEEDIRQ